jgi:enoyl-[acyl-carrier protein] reductase/trans-2-enoyl-CoA reductase (NAD+)
LASRIVGAFGYGAATIGVSLEKPGTSTRPGTPGFYNNRTFDAEALRRGLLSRTLNGDAFSEALKEGAAEAVKDLASAQGIPPKIDLIIYSLASPVRLDPKDGVLYRSVIKPIGQGYAGKTVDMMTGKFFVKSEEPATEEEIAHTVKVMGGEDWEWWIDALDQAGVLAPRVRTIAYTYLGPELSWPIYKKGTLGRAKEDLERAARALGQRLAKTGGNAWVSVNKAVVTRSSAVIPIIPLYVSCLFKVMKEKNLHEGCIEQMSRLFAERLYTPEVPTDPEGRIRLDDWEMREDVQQETIARMEAVTEATVFEASDLAGFKQDFLEAHGFGIAGLDYEAAVDPADL